MTNPYEDDEPLLPEQTRDDDPRTWGDNDSDNDAPIGRATQALTDTDSDGMDDTWETTYFGNLSATSAADADADGMTNGEEYLYDFVPNVNDAFADADGDETETERRE